MPLPRQGQYIARTTIMFAVSASHARAWGFGRMASVDNPKASKATKYGFLNAILYMAPASSADGTFNLCANAGSCVALCLGRESGQAAIRKAGQENPVTMARAKRAIAFMRDRVEFMAEVERDVARLSALATRMNLVLCYRFNGSTDIGYGVLRQLIEGNPHVLFIDYTKNPGKMAQYLAGRFAPNYHVTFSLDRGTASVASNERLALRFLAQGGNVTVVSTAPRPESWQGFPTVDGDTHDIRTPDMDGRGRWIWLTPKGLKARRDESGFVVRLAA
jgi:hypothetical protein